MSLPSEQSALPATPPGLDSGSWSEWDQFLAGGTDAGFMQSSWWADFRLTTGYEHFGAVARHRGSIIGGAIVHKLVRDDGSCFYYVPEGPVLPPGKSAAETVLETVLEGIDQRRAAEDETVSHLRIEPRWETVSHYLHDFQPVPEFMDAYMEPRDTLCIDLRPSEEDILAQMKPKGRYNVRVARKHGVAITEDPSERGLADFLTLYEEMTERQGIAAKPEDYFRDLVAILAHRDAGSVFLAELEGERIAAAIVVWFGRRATYFFGASTNRHRHVMAPYLLHFEIMRRARGLGCEWYDLWGVAPPGATEHPWAGISAFKRKLGGRETALVPTLDYIYDQAAYERYLEAEADVEARDPARGSQR